MKFQKTNILHYFLFSLFFIVFSFCFLIIYCKPYKNLNQITLYGHKLIGNLEVMFINQVDFKKNYVFLTLNFKDYLQLKKKYSAQQLKSKILYALIPTHLYKALSSRAIIASHGIFFHKHLTKLLGVKTVYCGHAIEGAYPVIKKNGKIKLFNDLKYYSKVWMYSEYEKKMFTSDFQYPYENLVVNGYPRVYYLVKNLYKSEKLKLMNSLSGNVILYAPTASRNNNPYLNSIFSPFKLENLKKFEKLLRKTNSIMVIKTHLNDKLSSVSKEFIQKSKYLKLQNELQIENDYDSMIMSDILITDYSTIYVDFLVTKKPIIFVNPPNPNLNLKYSKIVENKFINRIDNIEILFSKIKDTLEHNIRDPNLDKLEDIIFKNYNLDLILLNSIESIESL